MFGPGRAEASIVSLSKDARGGSFTILPDGTGDRLRMPPRAKLNTCLVMKNRQGGSNHAIAK